MTGGGKSLEELLGPEGPLAKAWPGYEVRAGQTAMALAVKEALETRALAVIEAGTGIGKTLAYLLPALMSGRKTIVSTGLKNLQSQIYHKDLEIIRRHFGQGFKATLVKGRENYLCLRRLHRSCREADLLRASGQKQAAARLLAWADRTADGDLESLPPEVKSGMPRANLSCPSELCKGSQCPHREDCFLQRNRREAQAADLVLVNHHLFMADLVLRGEGGQVLPDWDVAIFDEAHILEDVATGWFGRSIDTADLARLADQAVAFMEGGGPHESQELALLFFNEQAELPDLFEAHYAEDLIYPADSRRGAGGEEIRRRLLSLAELARGLRHRIPKPAEGEDDRDEAADLGDILKSRLGKLTEAATLLGKADDEGFVYQVEKKPRHNVALSAIPIEAGRILGRKLLEANRPVIMTSATLSAGGDFTYIRRRLGLDDENISEMSAVEDAPAPLPMSFLSIDSPYDYARDTVLYVPAPPFPGPDSDAFALEMPALIERLLGISGGRAMALFTSNRSLNSTASLMRRRKWPFRLLVQDEGSDRAALLRDFRDDVTSVLLATASFWQGVDVPGESLSVVVIDRLPFPRPNSPIFDARSRAVEEAGGSSFNDFSVPQMIISLRQGLGRLLRTSTDRGVLAILDNRLITKGYGRKIRRMLPPSPLTTDLAEVESFMKGGPPPKADPPPPKGTGRGAGRSRRRA